LQAILSTHNFGTEVSDDRKALQDGEGSDDGDNEDDVGDGAATTDDGKVQSDKSARLFGKRCRVSGSGGGGR
jgi:hypothetical protein